MNWIIIAIDAFVMGWVVGTFSFNHPVAGAALAILLLLNITALIVRGQAHVKAAALFCTLVVAIKAMLNPDYYAGLQVWDVQLGNMVKPDFELNRMMFGLIAINAVALVHSIYAALAEPEMEEAPAAGPGESAPDSRSAADLERPSGPSGGPGGDSPPNP